MAAAVQLSAIDQCQLYARSLPSIYCTSKISQSLIVPVATPVRFCYFFHKTWHWVLNLMIVCGGMYCDWIVWVKFLSLSMASFTGCFLNLFFEWVTVNIWGCTHSDQCCNCSFFLPACGQWKNSSSYAYITVRTSMITPCFIEVKAKCHTLPWDLLVQRNRVLFLD